MSVFTLNKNNEKINNINISTFDKNNNIFSKKDLLMESLIQFFSIKENLDQVKPIINGNDNTPSQSQQLTPADVGLGRMDIMGLPIGPKLSISSLPDGGIQGGQATFQGGPPNQPSTLNLQPAGTKQEQEIKNAQALEAINESL